MKFAVSFIKLIDQRLNHDITKSEVLKALNLTFEDIAYQKDKIKQVEQFLKSRFIDKSLSSLLSPCDPAAN
ncbi:hypothetical protein ACVNP0_04130 [Staphylococcus aureus]